MKTHKLLILSGILLIAGCRANDHEHEGESRQQESVGVEHETKEVHLSSEQFNALRMKVDTLTKRSMSGFVDINGQLTLPPQSRAAVTAIVGATVYSVEVIEGNSVEQGQALAYLYHPNLIKLQTDYATQVSQLEYLEIEYERQEKLFNESVASGRDFQKVKSEYLALRSSVSGLEAQLKLLQMDPERIKNDEIYQRIPLRSPLQGFVHEINVSTGQYVKPEDVLFEIVKNDHIHAHFKVFEKDVQKVQEGDKVEFVVESMPEVEHTAVVFAVGKVFETDVNAVNIHAEIENESGQLLSGMYARGKIILSDSLTYALPNEAVVLDGDRYYIFSAELVGKEWHFTPMEISIGLKDDDWTEIRFHQKLSEGQYFAWNNAYYLIAESQKGEAGHDH